MSRSKLSDVEIRSLKTTGNSELAGAATFSGAVTASSAVTINGPLIVNSTSVFNGPATFASSTVITTTVPATFTAAGVAGQIAISNTGVNTATSAYLYVCYATNLWGRVVMSATAFI